MLYVVQTSNYEGKINRRSGKPCHLYTYMYWQIKLFHCRFNKQFLAVIQMPAIIYWFTKLVFEYSPNIIHKYIPMGIVVIWLINAWLLFKFLLLVYFAKGRGHSTTIGHTRCLQVASACVTVHLYRVNLLSISFLSCHQLVAILSQV